MEFIINFQNSMLYEIVRQSLACVFYALFIIYIFYKVYNCYFIKKLNCKAEYREKKKKISNELKEKYEKIIKKIFKYLLSLLIFCIAIVFFIFLVNVIIFIFTGFGIGLAFSSTPISTFIKSVLNILLNVFVCIPSIILCLIPFLFYGLMYCILIKRIYININIKKFLKEKSKII